MDTHLYIGIGFLVAMVILLTFLLSQKNKEVEKKKVRGEAILADIQYSINRINESIVDSHTLSLMILESRVSTARNKVKEIVESINKFTVSVDSFNRGDVILLFNSLNRLEMAAILLEKCYIEEKRSRNNITLFEELNPEK